MSHEMDHPEVNALLETMLKTWNRSANEGAASPLAIYSAIVGFLSGIIASQPSADLHTAALMKVMMSLARQHPRVCLHSQIIAVVAGWTQAAGGDDPKRASVQATTETLTAMGEAMATLIACLDGEDAQHQAIAVLQKGMAEAVAAARQRGSKLSDFLVGRRSRRRRRRSTEAERVSVR